MTYADTLAEVTYAVRKHTGIPLNEILSGTVIGEKVGEVAREFDVKSFSVDMTVEQLALVVAEMRDFPPNKVSE